jgi:hypothetical protein
MEIWVHSPYTNSRRGIWISVNRNVMVFRDVMPWGLVYAAFPLDSSTVFSYPKDTDSRFFRNVGTYLPSYMAYHPKL